MLVPEVACRNRHDCQIWHSRASADGSAATGQPESMPSPLPPLPAPSSESETQTTAAPPAPPATTPPAPPSAPLPAPESPPAPAALTPSATNSAFPEGPVRKGFYFRLSLGPGFVSGWGDGPAGSTSINGGALSFATALGGAPTTRRQCQPPTRPRRQCPPRRSGATTPSRNCPSDARYSAVTTGGSAGNGRSV